MNTLSPFLSVDSSCEDALQWTRKQLLEAGLQTIQTFDLHTARLGLDDCSCPNHGTEECDCQLIVLLVYGAGTEPLTLILHGNDGKTWLSITDSPNQKIEAGLMKAVHQALEVKTSELEES